MTPWFRRKRFGYGWTPAGWEGWAATLLLIAACLGISDPELVQLDRLTHAICLIALIAAFLGLVLATSEKGSGS